LNAFGGRVASEPGACVMRSLSQCSGNWSNALCGSAIK
jgi:hypothetical protein